MVEDQIAQRGIKDTRVLEAMRKVPRHLFVPAQVQDLAYADHPLPIGAGQTISQPYIVALMTELARVKPDDKVLEIGTGSGYQAAVLAVLVARVYTIEYIEQLATSARQRLKDLKYDNVEVKFGDGYQGWPEYQPFDAILVTAACEHVPQPLIDQLKPGGRLVVPVGAQSQPQTLQVLEKDARGRISQHEGIPVRFVPLLGEGAKTKVR
jgi:protein-L-isoaspartate(D-aspartate) O-methyltransferase